MDVLLNDAYHLIELIMILLFTPGGEFNLEDEFLPMWKRKNILWFGAAHGQGRHRILNGIV
jgi:hypothetical protein